MRPLVLERCRVIANLRDHGKTLQQIGDYLGVSRERVRQLEAMARDHGIAPQKHYVHAVEAAKLLGVSLPVLMGCIRRLGLVRGRNLHIAIPKSDLLVVEEHLKTNCPACGAQYTTKSFSQRTCGNPDCRHEYRANIYRKLLLAETADDTNTTPDHCPRIVLDAVRSTDPGEEFVTFGEAIDLSGISRMQMVWLRLRGIIATRDDTVHHPVTRKLCKLYSKAQCLAIWHAMEPEVVGEANG